MSKIGFFVVLIALCSLVPKIAAKELDNPIACSICQLVINFVEAQASDNATIDKIDGILTKVCTKLHVADWCNANLLPLIPQIIQGLSQKEQPQVVCHQIHLCAPQMRERRVTQANPLTCGLCTGVVALLENQAQNNWTVTKLDDALTRVCARLRATNWCQQNLLPKVSDLINMIVQHTDPSKLCTKIKLCNNSSMVGENAKELKPIKGLMKKNEVRFIDIKCSVCEALIGIVRSELGNDKTQAAIQAGLNKACSKVKFASAVCSQLLGASVAKIVQDLASNVETHKICANIEMCNA